MDDFFQDGWNEDVLGEIKFSRQTFDSKLL